MSMTIPFEDVGSEYYRDTYWLYKGWIYKCENAYSEAYLYCAHSCMGNGETILELDGFEHPVSAKDCVQVAPDLWANMQQWVRALIQECKWQIKKRQIKNIDVCDYEDFQEIEL